MNESRDKVARAWLDGQRLIGSNVSTDGQNVYSYMHCVGVTDGDGRKIAYDCHFSVTTAKHCRAFKESADEIVPCRSCEPKVWDRRPDGGRCK